VRERRRQEGGREGGRESGVVWLECICRKIVGGKRNQRICEGDKQRKDVRRVVGKKEIMDGRKEESKTGMNKGRKEERKEEDIILFSPPSPTITS